MNKERRVATIAVAVSATSALALSGCGAFETLATPEPTATTKAPTRKERKAERQWKEQVRNWKKEARERRRDPEAYWAKKRIEIWGYDPGPGGSNHGTSGGRCVYDPTMNWDWHDDMVCDGQRLYLLPNDDYVDRRELERAAQEWLANH